MRLKINSDFDLCLTLIVICEEFADHNKAIESLDAYDFAILPSINPDGYEYSHTEKRLPAKLQVLNNQFSVMQWDNNLPRHRWHCFLGSRSWNCSRVRSWIAPWKYLGWRICPPAQQNCPSWQRNIRGHFKYDLFHRSRWRPSIARQLIHLQANKWIQSVSFNKLRVEQLLWREKSPRVSRMLHPGCKIRQWNSAIDQEVSRVMQLLQLFDHFSGEEVARLEKIYQVEKCWSYFLAQNAACEIHISFSRQRANLVNCKSRQAAIELAVARLFKWKTV